MKYPNLKFFKDSDDQWRWRIKAQNGNQLSMQSEGVHNYEDAVGGYIAQLKLSIGGDSHGIVSLVKKSIDVAREEQQGDAVYIQL